MTHEGTAIGCRPSASAAFCRHTWRFINVLIIIIIIRPEFYDSERDLLATAEYLAL